ncbi:hypothetical protein [Carnobacterium divergens]|uniref:L,D-transpeptidase family protein n=1 Tax=Carnobacterium divergens TaxID=2748 RepID=UPI0039C97715
MKLLKNKKVLAVAVVGVIALGGGTYAYNVHASKIEQQEQARDKETKFNEKLADVVNSIYLNDKKELLKDNIKAETVTSAKKILSQSKDEKADKSLINQLETGLKMIDIQTRSSNLFESEGVAKYSVDIEGTVPSIESSLKKIANDKKVFVKKEKEKIVLFTASYNQAKETENEVLGLFDNETVKDDVTREKYEEVKNKVAELKQENLKKDLEEKLVVVDTALTEKEAVKKQEEQKTEEAGNQKTDENGNPVNTASNGEKPNAVAGNQGNSTGSNSNSNSTNTGSNGNGSPAPGGTQQGGIEGIIASSPTAQYTDQIVGVVASGASAQVYLFEKNGGQWQTVLSTSGMVGSQGVGQASEYVSRTPKGSYGLGLAFGTGGNPGAQLPYRQITNNSYWISNVNDPQYNTWQERPSSDSADEHLASYPQQYQYGIALNYNGGVGGGSAFFLHCSNGAPTAGCIAVPTGIMQQLITRIHGGAHIINVNSQAELANY